jgi:ribosomal protein S27AE
MGLDRTCIRCGGPVVEVTELAHQDRSYQCLRCGYIEHVDRFEEENKNLKAKVERV